MKHEKRVRIIHKHVQVTPEWRRRYIEDLLELELERLFKMQSKDYKPEKQNGSLFVKLSTYTTQWTIKCRHSWLIGHSIFLLPSFYEIEPKSFICDRIFKLIFEPFEQKCWTKFSLNAPVTSTLAVPLFIAANFNEKKNILKINFKRCENTTSSLNI